MSDNEKNTNTNTQLVENGYKITKRDEIAECFDSYCMTITETLKIEKTHRSEVIEPFSHPVVNAEFRIRKCRLHPIIVRLRRITLKSDTLEFRLFEPAEAWHVISRLDNSKKASGDLPTYIFKPASDLSFSAVTKLVNEMVKKCTLPDRFKLTDVSPVFKSGDEHFKTTMANYCPFITIKGLSAPSFKTIPTMF